MAAGATYSVAPGLALSLTYVWGERRENGYDFLTSETTYPVQRGEHHRLRPQRRPGPHGGLPTQQERHGLMLGAQLTW